MVTVKQIERLWEARTYGKLMRELMVGRGEASNRLLLSLGHALPTAAMVVVRLEELSQSYLPVCSKLIRTILSSQDSDGGWGDPLQTALCLRALLCAAGDGKAIQNGLLYLANMQKSSLLFPKIPIRRAEEDPFTSAFILYQLGDQPEFRRAVQFPGLVQWFVNHEQELDEEARRLWARAKTKCGASAAGHPRELVWS